MNYTCIILCICTYIIPFFLKVPLKCWFFQHFLLLVVVCQGEEVSMDAALSRRVPKERTHEAPPRGELGQALEEAWEGGEGVLGG